MCLGGEVGGQKRDRHKLLQSMNSEMRTVYCHVSNKGLSLEFLEGYWVQQKAQEEGYREYSNQNIVSIATKMSIENNNLIPPLYQFKKNHKEWYKILINIYM